MTSSYTSLPLSYLLHHNGFPQVLRKCQTHTDLNIALALCSSWDIFPLCIYTVLISFKLASSDIKPYYTVVSYPSTQNLLTLPHSSLFFLLSIQVIISYLIYIHTYRIYIIKILYTHISSICILELYYVHLIIYNRLYSNTGLLCVVFAICFSPLELKL